MSIAVNFMLAFKRSYSAQNFASVHLCFLQDCVIAFTPREIDSPRYVDDVPICIKDKDVLRFPLAPPSTLTLSAGSFLR